MLLEIALFNVYTTNNIIQALFPISIEILNFEIECTIQYDY